LVGEGRTGLDLSISYGLVIQQHDGMITVDSRVGVESTFCLSRALTRRWREVDSCLANIDFRASRSA
jgi:light-regulated signal transduction histidine kinase (bacteriophytochrome)